MINYCCDTCIHCSEDIREYTGECRHIEKREIIWQFIRLTRNIKKIDNVFWGFPYDIKIHYDGVKVETEYDILPYIEVSKNFGCPFYEYSLTSPYWMIEEHELQEI